MDSSGRRKACVCPFHNHVHAVGNPIIGLVIMSKIMGGTGQTSVLADGIARVLGKTPMSYWRLWWEWWDRS